MGWSPRLNEKRHEHSSGYKRDVPAASFLLSPLSWRNVKISSTSLSSFSHNLVITMEKVTNTNSYSIIQLKRSYTGLVAKLMLNLWLFCTRINCFLLIPNTRGQQPQYKLAISIAIREAKDHESKYIGQNPKSLYDLLMCNSFLSE